MRTFSEHFLKKSFLSVSLFLFLSLVICFPFYNARATGNTLQGPTPSGVPITNPPPTNGALQGPASSGQTLDTATAPAPPTTNQFIALTNLPGLTDTDGSRTLADYINVLYRISIGIGAFVAVIKITLAGIKYMGQDAGFSSKEEAKKDITNSLLGLLIMLSTVVILGFIYPGILNINVLQGLEKVKVQTQQPPALPAGTQKVPVEEADAFDASLPPDKRVSERIDIPQTPGSVGDSIKAQEIFNQRCAANTGTVVREETRKPGPLGSFGPTDLANIRLNCVVNK